MSHKTLLSSHMAAIASLASFDLNKPTELQHFIGGTKSIQFMKLEPAAAGEFIPAIDVLVGQIETGTARYGKAALEHLTSARDEFKRNNAMTRNGGEHVGSSTGADRRAPGHDASLA